MAAKKKPIPPAASGDFDSLVSSIVYIHQQTQDFATKAVNVALTLRNWLIGRQIEVYERNGADRATYGDKLMDTLAKRLVKQGWERCDRRELYRFRQFYLIYPEIVESLTPQSTLSLELLPLFSLLPPSPSPIRESVTPKSPIVETASPQLFAPHPELIFCSNRQGGRGMKNQRPPQKASSPDSDASSRALPFSGMCRSVGANFTNSNGTSPAPTAHGISSAPTGRTIPAQGIALGHRTTFDQALKGRTIPGINAYEQ